MYDLHTRFVWLCVALAGFMAATGSARGAEPIVSPPNPRSERLTYDPESDTWKMGPAPVAGTEEGDLAIARQWFARQDFKTALAICKQWIKSYGTTSPLYPDVLFLKATSELELGEYRAAGDDYQVLLNDYPGSADAEAALSGQYRLAEQYMAGKKRKAWGGLLRIKDREAGIKIMDDIIVNYPDTPLAEAAQRTKADYLYDRGDFEEAEEEYATFARTYPKSRWHARSLLRSAQAALQSFPGIHFDDAGLVEAQERFRQFLQSYPDQAQQHQVPVLLEQIAARRGDKTVAIAQFYERIHQRGAAIFYYRATVEKWPNTPAASEAEARLNTLGADMAAEPEMIIGAEPAPATPAPAPVASEAEPTEDAPK